MCHGKIVVCFVVTRFRVIFVHFLPCASLVVLNYLLCAALRRAGLVILFNLCKIIGIDNRSETEEANEQKNKDQESQ